MSHGVQRVSWQIAVIFAALLCPAIQGCGGEDEIGSGVPPGTTTPVPPAGDGFGAVPAAVRGAWAVTQGLSCATVMNLEAAGYAFQRICETDAGWFGSDIEAGDLGALSAGKLLLTPRRASCVDRTHAAGTVTYTMAGPDSLTLLFSDGALIFARVKGTAGSADVRFGCWKMDTFTGHPLQDL